MTLVLPVSAKSEVYFEEVKTLGDGYIVSLMVKNVENLGTCNAIIEFNTSEGVVVTAVTQGDGNNALKLQTKNINNTAGSVEILAWDVSTGHSGDVVICNIVYTGSNSNPFEIGPTELHGYTYEKIQHTGDNDIVRFTAKPPATKAADDSATSVATVSEGEADGQGAVAGPTEIVDVTNESSGEDNNGIPGFGLLTGLSVMLIAIRFLREDK